MVLPGFVWFSCTCWVSCRLKMCMYMCTQRSQGVSVHILTIFILQTKAVWELGSRAAASHLARTWPHHGKSVSSMKHDSRAQIHSVGSTHRFGGLAYVSKSLHWDSDCLPVLVICRYSQKSWWKARYKASKCHTADASCEHLTSMVVRVLCVVCMGFVGRASRTVWLMRALYTLYVLYAWGDYCSESGPSLKVTGYITAKDTCLMTMVHWINRYPVTVTVTVTVSNMMKR
jgi:hypothetical protein